MRLYYTGAKAAGQPQSQPTKSIGGYVSGTKVSSGIEGSLFANPSQSEIVKGGVAYILVSLLNTTGGDLTDVKIYYEQASDALFNIEMGVVTPVVDSCSNPVYELNTTYKAQPVDITFSDNENVGGAITVASLLTDGSVGIWVKRTINPAAADAFLSCANLLVAHNDPSDPAAIRDFPFDIKFDY